MVYQFAPQSRIHADANAAGELFERLEQKNRLTAAAVVDESRPEEAPLHDEFEWDDAVAGEKYREEQARLLIRSIRIVNEKQEPQRVYFNIVKAEPEYRSINTILRSTKDTAALLEMALRELMAFQHKYKEIKELSAVWEAADAIRRRVETKAGEEHETV